MAYKIILVLFSLLISTCLNGYSESGSTLFDNGIAEFQKGRYQDAVFWFTKLIEQEPFNAKAYKNRGVARLSLQKYDMAIEDLNSALNPDPQMEDITGNLGPAWHYKEEYKKAMEDFNSAMNLDPELEGIHSNIGVAWYYAREYKKAIAAYDQEVEKHPENYSAFFNRAISWVELKEYNNALKDLRSVLDIKPDEYWAIAYQGDIYVEMNNPVAARESYLAAMGLNTGNKYARDRLLVLDDKDAAQAENGTGTPATATKKSEKLESATIVKSISQAAPATTQKAEIHSYPMKKDIKAAQTSKKPEFHANSTNEIPNPTPTIFPVQTVQPVDIATSTKSAAAPVPPDVAAASTSPGKKEIAVHNKFAIQLGAFLNGDNAKGVITSLKEKGYVPRVLELQDKTNRQWTLVRTGAFHTEALAKKTLEKVKKDLKVDAVIRPIGKF